MACIRGDGDTAPEATQAPSAHASDDRGPTVNSALQPHAIPAALLGKWGINPADCDFASGGDKGVMIIAADGLTFFESRAQLAAVVSAGDDRVRAAFAFAGEGQNWTSEQELVLQSDGKSLIRREIGDPPATVKYLRCP